MIHLILAVAIAAGSSSAATTAPKAPPSCNADPGFHALDFWLGTWRVSAGGRFDGTDVVTKILGGCAVTEDWTDTTGHKGKSLFYYDSFAKVWEQVWVTDQATSRGGLKIKRLIATYADRGTRFQGILPGPPGSKTVLDRTTLRPQTDGTVRQVIEISVDGGQTWIVTYDAIYRRTT